MPRRARVFTTTRFGRATVEENLELAIEYITAAGEQGGDLVCLPETFANPRGEVPVPEEAPGGPTFDRLAGLARRYHLWVVAGMYVKRDAGLIENCAVVIDRQGSLAGLYAKVHPTDKECTERGVTPGGTATVIETEFGRMGFAICYDIGYPALWQQMADQGVRLVVWPSEYDGGFPLQVYACLHQYYVVSASRDDHSKVIDITGQVLKTAEPWHSYRYYGMISTEIDLEKELFHGGYNDEKLVEIQREFGDRVSVQILGQENLFTLQSNDADWPLARIKERFGMENFRDYHARAGRVQVEARERALVKLRRQRVPSH